MPLDWTQVHDWPRSEALCGPHNSRCSQRVIEGLPSFGVPTRGCDQAADERKVLNCQQVVCGLSLDALQTTVGTLFADYFILMLNKEKAMPVKHPASKHHMDAAERHHEAAKHHHAAATHHEAGDHDKAKEHSKKAREHADAVTEHGKKGHEEFHK